MQNNSADREPDLINAWRDEYFGFTAESKAAFGSVDAYVAQRIKGQFQANAGLQAEFGTLERYTAFMTSEAARRARRAA